MATKIVEDLPKRVIKAFMDVFILTELKNSPMSGYDVLSYVHEKFNMLVSSGSIYSLLYSLERKGLIQGVWQEKKRVYTLTKDGEHGINALIKTEKEIQNLLRKLSLVSVELMNVDDQQEVKMKAS